MGWRAALACAMAPVALLPEAAAAQSGSVSRPVVQPVPDPGSRQLNSALVRLGRNPRDGEALLEAGKAALAMGDTDAAIGFFRRAEQVLPADARVKAGLAGALVRNGDPFSAIPLFEEAERAGLATPDMLLDRGLAYDLVSDNARAQGYYRRAAELATGSVADEAVRRLALSLAIAGDRRGSEAALAPLLERQDKASWRARAFILAILGQPEEAVAITRTTMPESLSTAMAPYLRYMRTLTRAQQAAAVNLGTFPRASEIGRDDPRVALYAPPVRVAAAEPRASATPSRGRNSRDRRNAQAASTPRAVVPVVAVAPTRTVTPPPTVAAGQELPPIDQPPPAAPVSSTPSVPAPVAVAAAPAQAAAPSAAPAPAPRPAAEVAATIRTPAPVAPATMAAASPAPVVASPAPLAVSPAATSPAAPAQAASPAPAPAPAPARRPSLADAFSEFVVTPARETSPPPGAVDIRRITPARDRAAIEAAQKAAAAKAVPSHPSRIWVQVATGRDKAALAFDWRRMTRQNDAVLKGKRGFTAAWGQTNRLLTGPFESAAAANTFIAQLRRADIDGAFVWTSPAGQVVDAIVAAK